MFTGGRLPSSRSGSLAKLTGTSSGCGCGHGPHHFKYEPEAALVPPREAISEGKAEPQVDWRHTVSGDAPDQGVQARPRGAQRWTCGAREVSVPLAVYAG